ncbi:MAG: pyridoxamine 5'-phosphate oxidase [Phycisphaerales bacterium]
MHEPPTMMHGPMDQADRPGSQRLPEPLPREPFGLFRAWFDQARARAAQPNPNAFTLATLDPDGRLGARIVLCKGIDRASGHIVFYTNYLGRKGLALTAHPRAAAVFHWDHADRQVRIEGPVTRSPAAESDAYFRSRPWPSRIGAWASEQSRPIESRAALARKVEEVCARFGIDPARPPLEGQEVEIPRPPHWGGFRLWAERVEVWAAGEGRLHDRAEWVRKLRACRNADADGWEADSDWATCRLQP